VNQQIQFSRRRTGALCLCAVSAVLMATLWPFDFLPRNAVDWIQGTNGLRFRKAGVVLSSDPLKMANTEADSYSVEVLLRPASVKRDYTILGFHNPTRTKQLLVKQWTDGLLVTHDASVDRDGTGTIKFDVNHAFVPDKLVLVTLSSGPSGTRAYLNGRPAGSFPRFKISRSELAGEIVLGTSPVTYQPWPGEIHGLAVFAKELTADEALQHYHDWSNPDGRTPDREAAIAQYSFTEGAGREVQNDISSEPNLRIPSAFSVPHKALLRPAAEEFRPDRRYAFDIVINIAGFVPLGLIMCSYLMWTKGRWRATLIAIFLCGTLSFMIEVLQYYIPRRESGTTDVITNTLGAALGAALVHASVFRLILEKMTLIPGAQGASQHGR